MNNNENKFIIQCIPASSGFQVTLNFNKLGDIRKVDLLQWIDKFNAEISKGELTEVQTLKLLQVLLPYDIYEKIKGYSSATDQLKELIQLSIKPHLLQTYYTKLNGIKQGHYTRIQDYFLDIEKQSRIITIARQEGDGQKIHTMESAFFMNLEPFTAIHLQSHKLSNIHDAMEKLVDLENSIIARVEIEGIKRNHQIIKNNKYGKQIRDVDEKSKYKSEKGKFRPKGYQSGKWCNYHKTKSHNDSECNFQKTNKSEKNPKPRDERSNAIIMNKKEIQPVLKANIKAGTPEINALFDTGSSVSLIDYNLCIANELKIENVDSNLKGEVFAANGHKIDVIGKVQLNVKFPSIPSTEFKIECLVTKNLEQNLIIGMDFLEEQETIINLRDGTITINNSAVELPSNSQNDSMDQEARIKLSTFYTSCLKNKMAENSNKIFSVKSICHKIETTNHQGIALKQYPVPLKLIEKTRNELNKLLQKGIIRRSENGWSSPAFVIIKKNGEARIVVDYRHLNSITEPMHHPNPATEEMLRGLNSAKIFSTIDLEKGYHQIPIYQKHIYKTGFVILNEHYEYTTMPLGLSNAPKTFQKIMQSILGHLPFLKIYLDDILVFSKNETEHNAHLKTTLDLLRDAGLTINAEKSKFNLKEVRYLGRIIDSAGIRIDTEILDKIVFKKAPKTKRQLQRLIGTINWARPFISNLSSKIVFLTNKLQGNKKIEWTPQDSIRLQEIVNIIKNAPRLNHADPNKTYQLYTDASDCGIGAILKQGYFPVGIFSRKLNQSEKNYSIVEKEAYAVIKAIQHFSNFLLGSHTTIYTDSRNILSKQKLPSSRIARWFILISEFSYELKHIEGKKNITADALSRCNVIQYIPSLLNESPFSEKGLTEKYNVAQEELEKKSIKIPREKSQEFIEAAHIYLGHPGICSLVKTLKTNYRIVNMKKIAEKVCKNCEYCNRCKNHHVKYGFVNGMLASPSFNAFISMDLLGPIEYQYFRSQKIGSFYLLVISDIYSRYTRIALVKNLRSSTTWNAFQSEWITEFGPPKKLLTDQGVQFTSDHFREKINSFQIKQIFTTPRNPQGNGITERTNSTINTILRIYRGYPINEVIEMINRRLNYIHHRIRNAIPHSVIYKEHAIHPRNIKIENKELNVIPQQSKSNAQKENLQRKNYEIKENEIVYLKSIRNKKLENRFDGPYRIKGISGKRDRVKIEIGNKEVWMNVRNVKFLNL